MKTRSVWAVIAGALVVIGATALVDTALHALGVFPHLGQAIDNAQALIGTSYRVVIGIAGAWLTARLAPHRPMRHALILGYIGTALGFVALVATWNQNLGPAWYSIAHVVLAIPEAWVGGMFYRTRTPVT